MPIDSKQMAKNGSVKMDPQAAKSTMQMSDQWINAVLTELDNTDAAAKAVKAAIQTNTLVKAVAFIDRATGELKILRIS